MYETFYFATVSQLTEIMYLERLLVGKYLSKLATPTASVLENESTSKILSNSAYLKTAGKKKKRKSIHLTWPVFSYSGVFSLPNLLT